MDVPEWTAQEFETLVTHPELGDAEIARLLPLRSAGAVGVVRAGIHEFHRGGDSDILSERMRRRLEHPREPLTCAVCDEKL